ncbi:hypothetical protein HAX54_001756 [Datura stramonium]|uniref:Uncharacterized protein n=1 Tax=Datura stramonium TaxID=4076 RepID=A0ABS8RV04_DATST|nr:hypothetical protein [Datura stramonium]
MENAKFNKPLETQTSQCISVGLWGWSGDGETLGVTVAFQNAIFIPSPSLTKDYAHWDIVVPLSYGRSIEAQDGRYRSLIFGDNLTDVVIMELLMARVLYGER